MVFPPPAATADEKKAHETFFKDVAEVEKYAKGASLTELIDRAAVIHELYKKYNPHGDGVQAEDWHLHMINSLHALLRKAIVKKKEYYESHWGGIFLYFMNLYCGRIRKGETPAILAVNKFIARSNLDTNIHLNRPQ